MAEEKTASSDKTKKKADPLACSIDEATQEMIAHIDKKRKEIGIDRTRESVLMDMIDRREMEASYQKA